MKFKSKAHMAQELMSGKRFDIQSDIVIYYDPSFQNPFRCNEYEMSSIWNEYDKDIWTEVKPRHIHQDLIDLYQKGQAWQYKPAGKELYTDCIVSGIWVEPVWAEDTAYRLHPHNDLIQAHRKGAKIQTYICGDWVEEPNPDWYEDTQYRIKPLTKTVYEWMFNPKCSNNWVVISEFMSEEKAERYFIENGYRKTGRSWEIEV